LAALVDAAGPEPVRQITWVAISGHCRMYGTARGNSGVLQQDEGAQVA
jgi:hypothetical protein